MTHYTSSPHGDFCPVCDKPINPDNPALYAMGWHVVVCCRKCQQEANRRLAEYGERHRDKPTPKGD